MQTLSYLINKLLFILKKNTEASGFTILECILAVGVLSTVLASLVGLQSSIIYVAQNSMDKLKAVWSMRQAYSQIDYLLDTAGFNALSETSQFVWPGDNRFTVAITKKDLEKIKPSQFLTTALTFYNLVNPNGNSNLNVDQTLAPIAQILDNIPVSPNSSLIQNTSIAPKANQSHFINLFVTVSWKTGAELNSLSDGLFLIDNNAFANLKLPNLGSPSNSNSNTNNDSNKEKTPPPSPGGGP